jgi:hypothetical protein
MAQPLRTRLTRIPKKEEEIHLFSNPSDEYNQIESKSPSASQKERERLAADDYQAPLTAHSLQPNSNWLIVRRNLHRIRFMGFNESSDKQERVPNLYLGLQMTRELKRAQEEIKNIDKQEDFYVIKQFVLAGEKTRSKPFDTSHVKPEDALIYDRLGEEPLALQNLLYYFSKQDVQHGTMFWDFLNEVNHVIKLKRKRTLLIQRLRRLALTLAVIIYGCIGLMLFLMIISIITTATKMNDPEVQWMNQNAYSPSR